MGFNSGFKGLKKILKYILKSEDGRFLPYPFLFIIHWLSYYLTRNKIRCEKDFLNKS